MKLKYSYLVTINNLSDLLNITQRLRKLGYVSEHSIFFSYMLENISLDESTVFVFIQGVTDDFGNSKTFYIVNPMSVTGGGGINYAFRSLLKDTVKVTDMLQILSKRIDGWIM